MGNYPSLNLTRGPSFMNVIIFTRALMQGFPNFICLHRHPYQFIKYFMTETTKSDRHEFNTVAKKWVSKGDGNACNQVIHLVVRYL